MEYFVNFQNCKKVAQKKKSRYIFNVHFKIQVIDTILKLVTIHAFECISIHLINELI